MAEGEGDQNESWERPGICSSIPIPVQIGNPSPGNSHHQQFVLETQTNRISALNTEPISLVECDAGGPLSRVTADLPPSETVPKGETLKATDIDGAKYVISGIVKYKHYANYKDRLASFPKAYSSVKTPEELASAGFYYHRAPDSVVCFCCGRGFKDWLPEDDPCKEHRVQSPSCLYMQVKGSQTVSQQIKTNTSASTFTTNGSTRLHQEERKSNNAYSSSSAEEREIYQAIDDMGFCFEDIQQAIRCVQGKGAKISLNEVINTILDVEQKKNDRAAPVCFLCEKVFRNGYTLCPCGHLAICLHCDVKRITKCPVCREKVTTYYNTYP